jgi:hypothetical protein
MNPLTSSKITRMACYAMVALVSACGGAGLADKAAAPAAAVPTPAASSQASSLASPPVSPPVVASAEAPSLAAAGIVLADLPVPLASGAPQCPQAGCVVTSYDELAARPVSPDVPDAPGYLVPPTEVTSTVGEAPYPDLRMLPSRIMPFEPVVFGDVSLVAVTSVR